MISARALLAASSLLVSGCSPILLRVVPLKPAYHPGEAVVLDVSLTNFSDPLTVSAYGPGNVRLKDVCIKPSAAKLWIPLPCEFSALLGLGRFVTPFHSFVTYDSELSWAQQHARVLLGRGSTATFRFGGDPFLEVRPSSAGYEALIYRFTEPGEYSLRVEYLHRLVPGDPPRTFTGLETSDKVEFLVKEPIPWPIPPAP